MGTFVHASGFFSRDFRISWFNLPYEIRYLLQHTSGSFNVAIAGLATAWDMNSPEFL